MPDDLWLKDPYAWSLQQAERLRRLRAGERVNDLDWDNIIEEIEALGRSEIEAVRSLLVQSVLHLLKLRAWPQSSAARKWRNDAGDFLVQAQRAYRPSMAQRLELEETLDYAMQRFRVLDYPGPRGNVPLPRPIPLEAVVRRDFTLQQLDAALFPPD